MDRTTVLVSGATIQAIGPVEDIQVPAGAEHIDISGKTIMPGLIDAHVHVGNIAVSMAQTAKLPPAVYVHQVSRILESDLNLGFTTLRDAGGLDSGFRLAIDQGLIKGPRLLLSINPLTPTGGHFDQRGPYDDQPKPRNSLGIYAEICDGADAVRRAARQVIRRGADQVKLAADGGVTSPSDVPGQWQFTVAELKAAVEIATAAGKNVMAHAYGSQAIVNCIEAGVRSVEHGNLMDAATADRLAVSGTYYVPTLTVYHVLAHEGRAELDSHYADKLEMVRHKALTALKHAYRAGVKIGSGSDIIGPYQELKGRELALKAQVMTPMEAIQAATRTNAELIGLIDSIGTLEPGKMADLIVVDGNPLDDLSLLERGHQSVVLVMKAGQIAKNKLP